MTLPSRLLGSSSWNTLSAELYLDPPNAEPFETPATDDLLVVTVLSGHYTIESASGRTTYHPGSVGLTAPGNVAELRWQALKPDPMESVHLRLRPALVENFRRGALPDALVVDDPLATSLGTALGRAVRDGAPALYADAMAQALAAQLLAPAAPETAAPLGRQQVRRVLAYLREHLADDVSLDVLAAQANVSKFHFVRLFTRATGRTPHRYLREVRLHRAKELLAGSADPVQRIAFTCGYRSPGQFAAAFRREYGVSPSGYRRGVSRSDNPTRS